MSLRPDLPVVPSLRIHRIREEFRGSKQLRRLQLVVRRDDHEHLQHVPRRLNLAIHFPIVFATFEPCGAHRTVSILQRPGIVDKIFDKSIRTVPFARDRFALGTSTPKRVTKTHQAVGSAASRTDNRLLEFLADDPLDIPGLAVASDPRGIAIRIMRQTDQREC